jgi:hypothetical protein
LHSPAREITDSSANAQIRVGQAALCKQQAVAPLGGRYRNKKLQRFDVKAGVEATKRPDKKIR